MTVATRLARLERIIPPPAPPNPFERYRDDPCGFAEDVLRVSWTPAQKEIAESLLRPPYRTLVKSAHNVGKTYCSASLSLWWYLTRRPAIVLTTAPKMEQVRDLLWKEIRRQSRHMPGAVHFPGPRMPRAERAADDFMLGTTASEGTAFQGHHGPSMFFMFDEGLGVDPEIWEVTETMFAPPGHAWLVIFNPTDAASPAYQAEMARDRDGNPLWHVITMSALDHPNIVAELKGEPPPIPSAIRLGRLNDMLAEWCDPVTAAPDTSSDFEWPPGSGKWLHPGPLAEARLLGRWPSQATGVWSDALWRAALRPIPEEQWDEAWPLVIGADIARFGDDDTTIHVRFGPVSLHHEWHNGWSTAQTAGRLKQLAREWTAWRNARQDQKRAPHQPEKVPIHIDDDGVGGGVTDQADGFTFVGLSGASKAVREDDYPNRRSELWFASADKARRGRLDLSRLPQRALSRLQQQLMAPTYKLDAQGRRTVEPKDKTKENLKRSPDDADGMNLAHYEPMRNQIVTVEPDPAPEPHRSEYERMREREQRGHWSERR